jgi:phosphoglycerate dehydrogenase-like enzyme
MKIDVKPARSRLDTGRTRMWVWPADEPVLIDAVVDAEGRVTSIEDAEAIVSFNGEVDAIRRVLHPGIRWVQLGSAGIEKWVRAGLINRQRVWTACRGVYARPIAEHALALILAAACNLPELIRASRWGPRTWGASGARRLFGRSVGIIGCGGIGEALVGLLKPFDTIILALTRTGRVVPGATISLGEDGLDQLLAKSDYVVVAAPHTPSTTKLLSGQKFGVMQSAAWLINVSRGTIVDTDALVEALRTGTIGGAALDVVEPEPLPDDHALWRFGNVIITPHTACSREHSLELFAARLRENLARFRAGAELLGVIDMESGY